MAAAGIARQLERIADALERLVELNAPPAPDLVELAEDFPGREALLEAGVVYRKTVPLTGEGLAALGLDGPTVNRILTRLKAEA